MPSERRRIDVWWWGDATRRLMLLMAYLMTRSDIWRGAKIRVLATGYEDVSEETIRDLRKTLDEVRIEAEPEIVAKGSGEAIAGYSAESAIVFLPFRLRGDQLMDPFGGPLQDLLPRLPIVALGLAAEDIDLAAEPEEGKAARRAAKATAKAEDAARAVEGLGATPHDMDKEPSLS